MRDDGAGAPRADDARRHSSSAVCVAARAYSCSRTGRDYRFYNWQMSVTRKPSYDLRSLVDRVTWFPVLHDIFTRMWFTVVRRA